MRHAIGHGAFWTIAFAVLGVPALLLAIKGFVALCALGDWLVS